MATAKRVVATLVTTGASHVAVYNWGFKPSDRSRNGRGHYRARLPRRHRLTPEHGRANQRPAGTVLAEGTATTAAW
jgi:hypothetical protein